MIDIKQKFMTFLVFLYILKQLYNSVTKIVRTCWKKYIFKMESMTISNRELI